MSDPIVQTTSTAGAVAQPALAQPSSQAVVKRYYIAPIIGTGTFTDPYRAKLPASIKGHAAVIPSDPAPGKPLYAWTLVLVSATAADHTAIAADAQVSALPGIGWEESVANHVGPVLKVALASQLQAKGSGLGLPQVQTDSFATGTLRQLVRTIGRQLSPEFDETNFGVGA